MASEKILQKKIDVNRYNYDKETMGRIVQLTAFFHMLKLDIGEDAFTEMASSKTTIFVPYSFNLYETLALAKYFRPINWYVELDTNNYAEIRQDEITIKGTKEFIRIVSDAFRKGESYSSDYNIFFYNFEERGNQWAWNTFTKDCYERLVRIGDFFIKNGNMMVYPTEEFEYLVFQESDFNRVDKTEMEYIILRSNIEKDRDRTILLDLKHKVMLATALNELEEEEILDYLV